jgi:hypothetical protein
MLLRLFSEAFGFELPNLGFGEIELSLHFEITTNGIGMPTFPVAYFAFEFTDLLAKLRVFGSELPDFVT